MGYSRVNLQPAQNVWARDSAVTSLVRLPNDQSPVTRHFFESSVLMTWSTIQHDDDGVDTVLHLWMLNVRKVLYLFSLSVVFDTSYPRGPSVDLVELDHNYIISAMAFTKMKFARPVLHRVQ